MTKQPGVYLRHIEECVAKIERYTAAGRHVFISDELLQDGVVRNFEIIGEAAKRLDNDVIERAPDVDWRRIKGFRDVLIHAYHDVDIVFVWEVVMKDLPVLKAAVARLVQDFPVEEE